MSEKKISRKDKEKAVLLGLVSLYLKTGKPIGSNTLRENGFDHLSSATIRNYFAKLEKTGYLLQQHASGGRIPTDLALKLYALNVQSSSFISPEDLLFIESILEKETKEVSSYLMKTIEALSEMSGCAALLLAPRFDQDFIQKIQLMQIDSQRALCVMLTDFGMVHTEILFTPKNFTKGDLEIIERYFMNRLANQPAEIEDPLIGQFALRAYNEVILRHVVHYTNFEHQDIYRTGFAKLLQYPEFQDIGLLASTLTLFENTHILRSLLKECFEQRALKFWIGSDLSHYLMQSCASSLIAIPYTIHKKIVGVIAILGPSRMPYDQMFGLIEAFANRMSQSLTQSLYKNKITYRQPDQNAITLKKENQFSYEDTTRFLLETQS